MAVVRLLSININVFVDSAESKWRTELMRLIGRHATDNLACKMSTRGESLICLVIVWLQFIFQHPGLDVREKASREGIKD